MTHGKNYILHHKPLYKQSYMYITETQKAIYGMGKNICKPYFWKRVNLQKKKSYNSIVKKDKQKKPH